VPTKPALITGIFGVLAAIFGSLPVQTFVHDYVSQHPSWALVISGLATLVALFSTPPHKTPNGPNTGNKLGLVLVLALVPMLVGCGTVTVEKPIGNVIVADLKDADRNFEMAIAAYPSSAAQLKPFKDCLDAVIGLLAPVDPKMQYHVNGLLSGASVPIILLNTGVVSQPIDYGCYALVGKLQVDALTTLAPFKLP